MPASTQPPPPGAEAVELLILDADGVLTDGGIWVDDQGRQMRRYSVRDGLAIGAWQRLGFKVAIISGRRGADLDDRARALGVGEDLVIQGVEDKAQAVKDLLSQLGLSPSQAAFLGDDVQDTPGMAQVGLPMAVADAEGPCLEAARWVTSRPGGMGAVRDAIEALIEARGLKERAMMLMSRPRSSGRSSAGVLVAVVMAVIFAGIVGFFVLRGGEGEQGRRSDIHNTPRPTIDEDDPIGTVHQAEIPIADREHPDRMAALLKFEESHPASQPRTYDIVKPQAFVYLDNGQTLHVQGETGRFIMASRQDPPESGMIRGDVILRLFDAADGVTPDGEALDVERETPVMIARTESLHFDANRGQLTNDERITIESPKYEFAASGITALFDREARRLLKLEFARGERLTYFPPAQEEEAPAGESEREAPAAEAPAPARPEQRQAQQPPGAAKPPAGGQAAAESAPPPQPAPPVETLYRAVFQDEVVLAQEGRQLTADQLDIWARLLDNRLPDGAIGTKNLPEASGSLTMHPMLVAVAQSVAQAGDASEPAATPAAAEPEAPITLTWSGKLSVLPIAGEPPQELAAGNHLSLEFTASRSGQVRFQDEELGATGFCQTLAYRATDQILTLWGIGARSGAALRAPGMGEIRGGRIEMNVATLMATIPGSGMLISLGEADAGGGAADAGQVTWGERAEFQFHNRPEDEAPEAIAIESALFRGNVEAHTPDGSIRAEVLRAVFDPAGAEGDQPQLRRLSARREADSSTRVLARSDRQGEIRCDVLDVWFAADDGGEGDARQPRAERLLAVGAVEASGQEASLTAGRLDATLAADDRGRAEVEKAEMTGGVVLNGRDADGLSVRARAGEITAWPQRQRAILVGGVQAPAHVERDGTSIEAGQLELDGARGYVNAFGAGELRHLLEHPQRDRRGELTATWTQQLTLDDETGEANLHGDVVATVMRPMEEDRIAAEVVRIGFTPRGEVSADAKAAAASGVSLGGAGAEGGPTRELLSATAIGSAIAGATEALATVRSGKWVADRSAAGGRRLVSLLSLEGPRIDADAVAGTLDVPGAGRLLMLDHRQMASSENGGDEPSGASAANGGAEAGASALPNPLDPGGAAHGATLINWLGSMRMERSSGRLDIDRAVKLSHKPSPDEPQMNLDCERLEALVRETEPGRTADQFQGELISAEAFGAVWVESGGRELVAERLTYDAITRELEATAPGSAVIMHDGGRAATATASRIVWNLATERIRIEEPGTVTAPAPSSGGN